MRKLFGGAAALGVAVAGSFAVAGPGFAQEEPEEPGIEFTHLDATLSPTEVGAEDVVTVTPEDNCSPGTTEVSYAVFHAGDYSWEEPTDAMPVYFDFAEVNEDGSWEASFSPADFDEDGVEDEGFEAAAEDPEEPLTFEVYGPLGFTVGDTSYEWVGFCSDYTEPEVLEMEITSHPFDADNGVYNTKAGDDVTVSSITPCPVEEGDWAAWLLSSETGVETQGEMELTAEGDWEFTFKAPAAEGFYFVDAACIDAEDEVSYYDYLVIANEVSGQPPVKPPTPATPIVEPPDDGG